MKRLVLVLFVLTVLSALVLGFGYAPYRVGSDMVGILFSRTSGWSQEPIDPTRFDWRWELLVPANATVHQFPQEQQQREFAVVDALPSAQLYAQYLSDRPSLQAEVRVGIIYRIKADSLAALAAQGVRPDNLSGWQQSIERELEANIRVAVERVVRQAFDSDGVAAGPTAVARISEEIQREIEDGVRRRIPEIELQMVVREQVQLPDVALYRAGRESYLQSQASRSAALAATNATHAVQTAVDQHRLETLERYGRLFTTYPVLLEYMDIVAKRGSDPLNIEALRAMGVTLPAQ